MENSPEIEPNWDKFAVGISGVRPYMGLLIENICQYPKLQSTSYKCIIFESAS